MKLICPICGKEFEKTSNNKIICGSQRCKNKRWVESRKAKQEDKRCTYVTSGGIRCRRKIKKGNHFFCDTHYKLANRLLDHDYLYFT